MTVMKLKSRIFSYGLRTNDWILMRKWRLCKIGNNHIMYYILENYLMVTRVCCVRTNLISVTQRVTKKLRGEVHQRCEHRGVARLRHTILFELILKTYKLVLFLCITFQPTKVSCFQVCIYSNYNKCIIV